MNSPRDKARPVSRVFFIMVSNKRKRAIRFKVRRDFKGEPSTKNDLRASEELLAHFVAMAFLAENPSLTRGPAHYNLEEPKPNEKAGEYRER